MPTEQALLLAFWGYTGEQNEPQVPVLMGGLALTSSGRYEVLHEIPRMVLSAYWAFNKCVSLLPEALGCTGRASAQ